MSRRSKAERQEQIAGTALKIIGTQGFHKFTTSTLSQEVGLAEGTIFRHFQNKDEIINASMALLEELLFQEFPPKDEQPLRRLRAFVIDRIEILRAHPEVRAVLFNEQLAQASTTFTSLWKQRIDSILKRSISFVSKCIKEAQEEGLIAADVPFQQLVWIVTGVVRGASMSAPNHTLPEVLEELSPNQIWTNLELLLRRTA